MSQKRAILWKVVENRERKKINKYLPSSSSAGCISIRLSSFVPTAVPPDDLSTFSFSSGVTVVVPK